MSFLSEKNVFQYKVWKQFTESVIRSQTSPIISGNVLIKQSWVKSILCFPVDPCRPAGDDGGGRTGFQQGGENSDITSGRHDRATPGGAHPGPDSPRHHANGRRGHRPFCPVGEPASQFHTAAINCLLR